MGRPIHHLSTLAHRTLPHADPKTSLSRYQSLFPHRNITFLLTYSNRSYRKLHRTTLLTDDCLCSTVRDDERPASRNGIQRQTLICHVLHSLRVDCIEWISCLDLALSRGIIRGHWQSGQAARRRKWKDDSYINQRDPNKQHHEATRGKHTSSVTQSCFFASVSSLPVHWQCL